MTAPHAGLPDAFVRLRASGWIISLCLHGAAVFLAVLFAAKIRLAPPSSSFRWDVTVVSLSVTPSAPSSTIDTPQTGPTLSRMAARSTPIPSPRQTAPELHHSTKSASAASSISHEPQTAAPASPPPPQDIEPTVQHSLVPPPPEVVDATRVQPPTERSPAPVVPSPMEVQQQQPAVTSLAKDHEGPIQQSSPLPASPLPASQQPTEEPVAPPSTAALVPSASNLPAPRKADYGWLAGILLPRIDALKGYPVDARLKHVEGRVVVRIVIQEDGQIVSAAIAKSSGHDILDQAALETVRKISPITLTQPLEHSPVTLHVPIRYQLGP